MVYKKSKKDRIKREEEREINKSDFSKNQKRDRKSIGSGVSLKSLSSAKNLRVRKKTVRTSDLHSSAVFVNSLWLTSP